MTSTVVAGEESEVACEEYRCSPRWLVMNTVHKLNKLSKYTYCNLFLSDI